MFLGRSALTLDQFWGRVERRMFQPDDLIHAPVGVPPAARQITPTRVQINVEPHIGEVYGEAVSVVLRDGGPVALLPLREKHGKQYYAVASSLLGLHTLGLSDNSDLPFLKTQNGDFSTLTPSVKTFKNGWFKAEYRAWMDRITLAEAPINDMAAALIEPPPVQNLRRRDSAISGFDEG